MRAMESRTDASSSIDEDSQVLGRHGNTRWNSPWATWAASSVPPWASAIARLTASPSPMPVALPDAKGSKRLSLMRRRHTRTIVRDDEADMRVTVLVGTNRNPTADLSRCGQRLDRIGEQVSQDHLDLQPIDEQRRQRWRFLDIDQDRLSVNRGVTHPAKGPAGSPESTPVPVVWSPLERSHEAVVPLRRHDPLRRESCRSSRSSAPNGPDLARAASGPIVHSSRLR